MTQVQTSGRRGEAGFTLVEIVVATAILMFLMFLVFTSLILGQRSVAVGMARARAEQNVNRVLSVIVPELRQSGAFFRGSDLTVPNTRTLRFRRVTGFDGTNPTWSEVVQYELNSGSVVRSMATGPSVPPTMVFASTPTELLGGEFRLNLGDGEVEIELTSTVGVSDGSSVTHTHRETVRPRN